MGLFVIFRYGLADSVSTAKSVLKSTTGDTMDLRSFFVLNNTPLTPLKRGIAEDSGF